VFEDEPEGIPEGKKNIFSLLDDNLDSCVIEEHLQEQQKK